jgi:hypothetical protein
MSDANWQCNAIVWLQTCFKQHFDGVVVQIGIARHGTHRQRHAATIEHDDIRSNRYDMCASTRFGMTNNNASWFIG